MKKVLCLTCNGKGTIDDPKCYGQLIGYCGQNGERFPQVTCETCAGTGWIEISDSEIIKQLDLKKILSDIL